MFSHCYQWKIEPKAKHGISFWYSSNVMGTKYFYIYAIIHGQSKGTEMRDWNSIKKALKQSTISGK